MYSLSSMTRQSEHATLKSLKQTAVIPCEPTQTYNLVLSQLHVIASIPVMTRVVTGGRNGILTGHAF